MSNPLPFWKTTALEQLNSKQWESLCDGCAKCCLQKLEDIDTQEIFYTNIACHLLDQDKCSCTDYDNRSTRVPSCVHLNLEELEDPYWLPSTCAYRLLAEGQDLPEWHPLVSGNSDTVRSSGNSIFGRVISEKEMETDDDLEHHLIDWVT